MHKESVDRGPVWVVDGSPLWRYAVQGTLHDLGFSTREFETADCCPSTREASVILLGALEFDDGERAQLCALVGSGVPVIVHIALMSTKNCVLAFRLGATDVCELMVNPPALQERIESAVLLSADYRQRAKRTLGTV
jgi:DNA-binding NtrC family response regulator